MVGIVVRQSQSNELSGLGEILFTLLVEVVVEVVPPFVVVEEVELILCAPLVVEEVVEVEVEPPSVVLEEVERILFAPLVVQQEVAVGGILSK